MKMPSLSCAKKFLVKESPSHSKRRGGHRLQRAPEGCDEGTI
jgi:hypothetical protein